MPKLTSPSSANSIKLRPRSSDSGHFQHHPQKPPRSKPDKSNGLIVPKKRTPRKNYSVAISVFVALAVADVFLVWNAINASIGGDGDEPHHLGATAGVHQLHASNKKLQTEVSEADTKSRTSSSKQAVDERIANILKSAHVTVDEETLSQLPTWEQVVSQYGEKPIIYGLETCATYRDSVKPEDRMVGPAGIFNTGTNILYQLTAHNCDIKEAVHSRTHKEPTQNGARWQVPWGKHNPPATHRLRNVAKMWGEGINQTAFFPVVMIKDPYHWMGSQCRHHYQAFWPHDAEHCPNLMKVDFLHQDVPVDVRVLYAGGTVKYESLTNVWNKWYLEYEEQTFPMLHTRFEDLLFHGEEVTRMVCDCVGGTFTKRFRYMEDSAKQKLPIHIGSNGLVKALLQYGNPKNRLNGLTDRERWYASKSLNSGLMQKFGYNAPPLPI